VNPFDEFRLTLGIPIFAVYSPCRGFQVLSNEFRSAQHKSGQNIAASEASVLRAALKQWTAFRALFHLKANLLPRRVAAVKKQSLFSWGVGAASAGACSRSGAERASRRSTIEM
jgi:hypothetical protein